MSIDPASANRQFIRLSGLSSGLDTESIVSAMLQTDQYRVDKQFQTKTKLEWKCDAYRETNLLARNFREEYMSVLNSENNMLSESTYKIFDVTMLDTTSSVLVSANSTAVTGSVEIDSITQLATAASVKSVAIYNSETVYMDTTLKDLDLVNPLQFVDNAISFSINDETFSFSEDTTIAELMSTVNTNTDAGVRMSYSTLTKGFSLTAKTTGSSSTIEIENLTGNAFAAVDSAFGISEGTINGQDAILSIEGIEVVRSNNTFTIDGISYSLKKESATSISFNVERNVDSTLTKIKGFIDSYNELVGELQSKYDETVYSSYPPLTDEQRESLSETEIEKWDNLSKSGLLNGNSNISSLLDGLRNAFYTTVEGIGKSPADIGLRTGMYYDKGKITIDETVLRTAIENNPDEVTNLFTKKSTSEDYLEKSNQSGLIARISQSLLQYTVNTTDVSIESAQRDISNAEDRMDVLIDLMSQKEDALWARFTAMETALSKMNSQSSWLSSQFATQE